MAQVLTDVAPVIDAALAALKKNLPGQVAAFNNNAANQTQIQAPQTYVFGRQDPRIGPYPLIEAAAVEGATEIIDLALNVDSEPKIAFGIWHMSEAGQLPDTYRQNLGLGKCVKEVLLQRDAFGPTVGVIDSRDRGALFWRSMILPADIATDKTTGSTWRCCYYLEITLPQSDGFATV